MNPYKQLPVALLLLTALLTPYATAQEVDLESQLETEIVNRVNQVRMEAGLKPTRRSTQLAEASRGHALEMLELNYFSHTSPVAERRRPVDRLALAGGWDLELAENIYRLNALPEDDIVELVTTAWLNSPAHLKNILNPEFNLMDVGLVCNGDSYSVVQMFSCQTVTIESLSHRSGKAIIRGRFSGSPERRGAVVLGDRILETFETDPSGEFQVELEVDSETSLGIAYRDSSGEFAVKAEFSLTVSE